MKDLKKPEVLVIGAQKSATTWLYDCMREHPGIFMPSLKRDSYPLGSLYYESTGIETYFNPFQDANSNQIIADSAVDYLDTENSPAQIKQYMPDCKFILMLRNPIDRAISAYFWTKRISQVSFNSPQEALRYELANPEKSEFNFLQKGLYYKYLSNYLEYFNLDNFLFVMYDSVNAYPEKVLKKVFEFCNVNPEFAPQSSISKPKQNSKSVILNAIESKIRGVLPKNKIYRVFVSLINNAHGRLGRLSGAKDSSSYFDDEMRAELESYFRDDANELTSLLGKLPDRQVVGEEFIHKLSPDAVTSK